MLGKVIQKWSILKSLHVPEMKGQLEAKNDTTGTISQFTVHRTHMRKVISANAEFAIEIIQHVRKKKIVWESQKTKHTGKLDRVL